MGVTAGRNRKTGADDLGNVSGSVGVALDGGDYDNKDMTFTADGTLVFTFSAKTNHILTLRSDNVTPRRVTFSSTTGMTDLIVSNQAVVVELYSDGFTLRAR